MTLPGGNVRVVTGDDRVSRTAFEVCGKNLGVQLLNFLDVGHGSDLAAATHHAVHIICGVRQEGREHEVQISHGLCQRPEHGRQALAFFGGLELEGLGICNVLVGLADQTHCSGKSGLLAVVTNQVSDLVKARGNGIQQGAVDFLELSRCRNLAELLVDHRGGAINQVAPACHQLAVRAADEFCPGEVRIRGLRTRR